MQLCMYGVCTPYSNNEGMHMFKNLRWKYEANAERSNYKLNKPLHCFPRGYTSSAAINNPTVIPIAVWIIVYPKLVKEFWTVEAEES